METSVDFDPEAQKLFVFDQVFSARAAQEQAEKKKLDAFGKLARFNPLSRPKPETVSLVKWELRHEPFWHIVAQREMDYTREAVYSVSVPNPHALTVSVHGHAFAVIFSGGKGRAEVPVTEHCHRKLDQSLYLDGLKRSVRPTTLQGYTVRYQAPECAELTLESAVINQVPLAAAVQAVQAKLTSEAIDAHTITRDHIVFTKAHLFYRPVFAFEFEWTAGSKTGVIEIDGLTGEAAEDGQWLREKIGSVMTRDTLFDLGADVAGMMVPGGSIAVKIIGKVTQSKS